MTFYSKCNKITCKVFLYLLLILPFCLNAQIEEETLFYKENVRYSSISTLVAPDKDYFFATNLFINVSDPNISNIELYKISDELEKLDSVTIDIKGKFISYDLIHKNDSIIIISMRDSLMEDFPSGQIFIYDEFLNLVDSSSLLLPDVSGSRTFRFNLQEDKMGSYFLHATILNIKMQDFILYSAKLDSNFEVQEFNKFSLRDGAIEASNVVKHNDEYYFIALELYRSQDGLNNWEEIPVDGIDELFYYPCQFVEFNKHFVVASQLSNFIHKRGLLVEFVSAESKVVKSNIYFEQFDSNGNLSYLSDKHAVIKNSAGDRIVIAGQNGFPIGSTFNYPKVNVPSNLFFIQYDEDFNETWIKALEGDAFYFMNGGIHYLTDEKIIGSGFKYAFEEDEFYGFIIMLDSETGDIISNVNTHNISPERLKLFPNPVEDQINIELPESDIFDYESFSIMNVHGAVLKQEAMTGSVISVGELPGGQYVLLLHGRGKVAVGKFVKM